jgi:tetratricopeptide (TPR) repeat protein
MSSQPKKKTVAQLRAERKQRKQDLDLGNQTALNVILGYRRLKSMCETRVDCHDELIALAVQADRACALFQAHQAHPGTDVADTTSYRAILFFKAELHRKLGHYNLAIATYRQADELYLTAERQGLLIANEDITFRHIIGDLGMMYLNTQQFDAAKSCFMRILA